jgi:hypothetical protein
MDQTDRNEGDFIDSELSAEDFLAKARNAGNRMPSSVMIRNFGKSAMLVVDTRGKADDNKNEHR